MNREERVRRISRKDAKNAKNAELLCESDASSFAILASSASWREKKGSCYLIRREEIKVNREERVICQN